LSEISETVYLPPFNNSAARLKYVNMVRNRAQEQPLATLTLDDIKTEKRLELNPNMQPNTGW